MFRFVLCEWMKFLAHRLTYILMTLATFRNWMVWGEYDTLQHNEVWMDPRYPWTFDNDLFGGKTNCRKIDYPTGKRTLLVSNTGDRVTIRNAFMVDGHVFLPLRPRSGFLGTRSQELEDVQRRFRRLQSPINIDPSRLLFDPGLTKLTMARHAVEATLLNTGQLPLIAIEGSPDQHNSDSSTSRTHSKHPEKAFVNITGGPGYPYTYQLHQVIFHYGNGVEPSGGHAEVGGSEHTINGARFPAEIQLMAFNSDLYENFSQAMVQPRGLLGISIIVDVGDTSNMELRKLTVASQSITYKRSKTLLRKFHPGNLLPKHHDQYVTYEGSLSYPGCYESVTWVVMNNPIYITREDFATWGELRQIEKNSSGTVSSTSSTATLPSDIPTNYRLLQPENGRLIRTNINVEYRSRVAGSATDRCPSNIYLDMGYRANSNRRSSNASVSYSRSSKLRVLPDSVLAKEMMREPINHYLYT